jgi:hypothetical protein
MNASTLIPQNIEASVAYNMKIFRMKITNVNDVYELCHVPLV